MDDKNMGFESRSTPGGLGKDRDDVSKTRSQTGHDTDGRSADYDEREQPATAGATTRSSLGDNRDGMGRDRTEMIAANETNKLISADKVIGTSVYNADATRLGMIDSVMLNKHSGKVAFAVMSFGGVLGIGERYHPLPWDVLTYDEAKGGYNVDLGPDRLKAAPHYSRDELRDFNYGERGPDIYNYYGVGGIA